MLVLNCISIIFFISYEFDIYPSANVLHCFAEYAVIHKLEESFQMNIWLQFFSVCENQYFATTKQTDWIVKLCEPSSALIWDWDTVEGFCIEVHVFVFQTVLELVF